ncbi:queuosine precursor transporter [Rhizobiales bacterium RZME27]|uniref:Probable queuosine precursor transporter n=1 Tax=Endobacterium cereale TaxID=2663029 RepID=A0A6A8AGA9_9HYPH|nr:queuosine precursor transporter [Endobacterium cereale]MEB2847708.1 queuosine precursor transporter [Endobacterium cereale]MQY47831.1 queuosine precursor transporter [Endobacterium cereale]
MLTQRHTLIYALVMAAIVVASNILVQFHLTGTLWGIALGDLLTWGAFTYPVAFLVTDLANRQFGPAIARRIVLVGFVVGVALSFWLSEPRIAIASGTAFLIGQLLDISVFNELRRKSWWKAPLAASMIGTIIDTALFFSLAFAPFFAFIGPNLDFAVAPAPILGVMATEAPRWISWALGDLVVKIVVGVVLLLPYGALMNVLKPMQQVTAR